MVKFLSVCGGCTVTAVSVPPPQLRLYESWLTVTALKVHSNNASQLFTFHRISAVKPKFIFLQIHSSHNVSVPHFPYNGNGYLNISILLYSLVALNFSLNVVFKRSKTILHKHCEIKTSCFYSHLPILSLPYHSSIPTLHFCHHLILTLLNQILIDQ